MVDKSQQFTLLVRVGYAARGVVYVLLGYLALSSTGNISAGPQASLNYLQDVPLGSTVLYLAAAGLLAYAMYKLIAALGDLERKGSDAKGIAQRIGYGASAVAHIVMSWSAFEFANGNKQSARGDSSGEAASTLLTWDMGGLVLGVIGLGFLGAAVFQGRSAITASFMRSVGAGAPPSVCWIGRIGHAARAIVFLVISWSLIQSAWFGEGEQVKGLGTALVSLGEKSALQTVVALGLLMFGVFSLVVARFRIIPDVRKHDLKPKLG